MTVKTVLVVAPHPDDETLGVGGAIARYIKSGAHVHWAIVTEMNEGLGYSQSDINRRNKEIESVGKLYGITQIHKLGFSTTTLDTVPRGQLVEGIKKVVDEVKPEIMYVPFGGDSHSDHSAVFQACASAGKWFRAPSLRCIRAYETLSETESALSPGGTTFRPNSYVDITESLSTKLEAMALYLGETGTFPFPRSNEAIIAQARFRGTSAGVEAAEAFMTLWEVE